jgi:hypothetical protein
MPPLTRALSAALLAVSLAEPAVGRAEPHADAVGTAAYVIDPRVARLPLSAFPKGFVLQWYAFTGEQYYHSPEGLSTAYAAQYGKTFATGKKAELEIIVNSYAICG